MGIFHSYVKLPEGTVCCPNSAGAPETMDQHGSCDGSFDSGLNGGFWMRIPDLKQVTTFLSFCLLSAV